MSIDKYLRYRGRIRAVVGINGTLIFGTVHREGQPTGLYRLKADKVELDEIAMPCGVTALSADQEMIRATGTDKHLYCYSAKGGAAKALGPTFEVVPDGLTLLSNQRAAVLLGERVAIVSLENGKEQQSIELPEKGTALASDPTGNWLVIGTLKGTIAVHECELQSEYQLSESAQLHEGAVTSLLFEREELRFFSAGADQKLFSTHARGALEPEDRGRSYNHSDQIDALLWASDNRFLSGSRDKTVKSWPWPGNAQPFTLKDGVGKVVDLALVQVNRKPHLAIVCTD